MTRPAKTLTPEGPLADAFRAYGQACAEQAAATLLGNTEQVVKTRKRAEGILRRAVRAHGRGRVIDLTDRATSQSAR